MDLGGMAMKKTKKSKYVSDETFAEIKESLEQALQHARGERNDLRVTRVAIPRPPRHMSSEEIVSVRKNLNYSQSVFARLLNVSVKTVQGWEQGLREPSDAALKLLAIAAKRPEVLLEV
jgi:putative transcriptional regulator